MHKCIYGNTRVLWRTERLLAGTAEIVFPQAYRELIDRVYQRDDWSDEPETIAIEFDAFSALQRSREAEAIRLTSMAVRQFRDEEAIATSLTRDDEMSLNVLPVQAGGRLLDGASLDSLDERARPEALNLNTVPVPASWKARLASYPTDEEGRIELTMKPDGTGEWVSTDGKFQYSQDYGLEKGEQ